MKKQAPETYRTLINSLREYDNFCLAADCLVTLRFRNSDQPQEFPAQIVDHDEDGRVYVKTHPRSEVRCVLPEQVRMAVTA